MLFPSLTDGLYDILYMTKGGRYGECGEGMVAESKTQKVPF